MRVPSLGGCGWKDTRDSCKPQSHRLCSGQVSRIACGSFVFLAFVRVCGPTCFIFAQKELPALEFGTYLVPPVSSLMESPVH